ncbi:MAG: hypothetical protein Q7V88_19695, partial [Actinomycetota bacterium]|nr:hypothetical protein [Actinomycetota bacterium]
MLIAFLAAIATSVLYSISAVLEDVAAKRVPTAGIGGRRSAVLATVSPLYLLGLSLSAVAWVASLVALHWLPLFVVQAMTASSIGLVVLITWARTRRAPSRLEAALLAGAGIGLVALAVSAGGGPVLSVGPLFRLLVW